MVPNNPYLAPKADEKPCIDHLLWWIWEREAIRIAKENGYAGELTKDPILKQYRFCNIRRRDDRVSAWLIKNLYQTPWQDTWFVAAIARYINWPPMLQILLDEKLIPSSVDEFDYVRFGECIDDVTRTGGKAWSGAYMTFPCKVEQGQPKGIATAKHILAPLKDRAANVRTAIARNKLEGVFSAILGTYGWQSFMCGQLVADLSYVQDFDDVYTWAPIGPGSQRGLNRLHGNKLNDNWKQDEFNEALINVWYRINAELGIDDLTLHDVQNCFCEIDKYWRVLYNEGRPRATYKPETAF